MLLERLLPHICFALFGLVSMLPFETRASLLLRREGIVMQLFLLEVRKRCYAPSIIWLHDGFWIDKHIDNEVFFAAERHIKALLFLMSDACSPLFHVTDLTDARDEALSSCPSLPLTPLICCPTILLLLIWGPGVILGVSR